MALLILVRVQGLTVLHDVQHSRPAQCKDVQHNAQVVPAGASTISKDARCSTRFIMNCRSQRGPRCLVRATPLHQLQRSRSQQLLKRSAPTCAPPRLLPWTNRPPPTMQRSRQAFEGHQRLSTPGHPPPPMTRADPGDAEEITGNCNVILLETPSGSPATSCGRV